MQSNLIGGNGHKRLTSLFVEFVDMYDNREHLVPIFTFSKVPADGLVSFTNVYLSCDTEYEACQKLLGDWEHWKALWESARLKPYIEQLREEAALIKEARNIKILMKAAEEGSVPAAKLLLDMNKKKPVGRPAEREQKAKEAHSAKVTSLVNRLKVND